MDKALFAEFPPISDEQWQQLVLKDLRGAAPETLEWESPEGIKVDPYYRATSQKPLSIPVRPVGEWLIRQNIDTDDAVKANHEALDALQRGATALKFDCAGKVDLETLLKGILIEHIDITWNLIDAAFLDNLVALIAERGIDAKAVKGSIALPNATNEACFAKYSKLLPSINLFTIAAPTAETLSEQTAAQLVAANALVSKLTQTSIAANDILPNIRFNIAVGTNYFFEIARIRTLRALWMVVCQQYLPGYNTPAFIHATNKAVLPLKDGYYEMIRQTTQALSAVIGGADSLSMVPHVNTPDKSMGFQTRIARNIQLIMQHESHLDTVADPAAGAWYIESITSQLATKTWEHFVKTTQTS